MEYRSVKNGGVIWDSFTGETHLVAPPLSDYFSLSDISLEEFRNTLKIDDLNKFEEQYKWALKINLI